MKENRLERLVRLSELRNEKGWSQEGVASILEIQRPQYTLYETGKRDSCKIFKNFSKSL